MELQQYIGIFLSIVCGVFGAYLIVRVAIAEIKKDISYLSEKLDSEIQAKNKLEDNTQAVINEVRDDVKAIFQTLTKMQVAQAKQEGQEILVRALKEAIQELNKK